MPDYNHSRPLDVHVWSEHSEINFLVDQLWDKYFKSGTNLSKRRGPKPKATKKSHLKALLIDMYVCWKADPTMYVSVHMSKSGWKANSRYNALNLSSQMIDVIKKLTDQKFLEFKGGFEGRLSRIRAAENLQILFHAVKVHPQDISFHHKQEMLELRAGMTPANTRSIKKIEYPDTEETQRMRRVLQDYNELLRKSHIDICSLETPYVDRLIKKGKRVGKCIRIHIDCRNIFVKRVFNNGSWKQGGRFYGGWWQQINKELRPDIMINNKPTVEVDYRAMHVALLFAQVGHAHVADPYSLKEIVFPAEEGIDQRLAAKQLVLMSLNATSRKKAYQAFRSEQPSGHKFKRLTDKQLTKLLDAFEQEFPLLGPFLCTGKGLELMYLDSCIAEHIIQHFTAMDVPILCLHDSFIVPSDHVIELRNVMTEAGNKYAKRFMFTSANGVGLDEWLAAYSESGTRPSVDPKSVICCDGYNKRIPKNTTGRGLMSRPN